MERRLSSRIKVLIPIEILQEQGQHSTSFTGPVRAQIVDVSLSGMCVISDQPLEFVTTITLDKKGTAVKKIESNPKQNHIEMAWQKQTNQEGYPYRAGIHFKDPLDQALSELIKELEEEQNELALRHWQCARPETIFPSFSLDSPFLKGLSPSALAVDVTNLCNLRCKHCFWDYSKGQLPPLTNPYIIEHVKEALMKFPSITNILWYGGEPLLNKETIALIEQGIPLKKNNLIITNGTHYIPNWNKNVHFKVSLDGTEKTHDELRGQNVYKKVKSNIMNAVKRGVKVSIPYCINAINIDDIPQFLDEWNDSGVAAIVFTMYVPIIGKSCYLDVSDKQMEAVADLLLKMKKRYKDLICNSELMLELLRPKYGEEMAANCPMNVFNKNMSVTCLHLCNDGTVRVPCSFGKDACHRKCRSVTKVGLYALKVLHDKDSLFALFKMFHSHPFQKTNGKGDV